MLKKAGNSIKVLRMIQQRGFKLYLITFKLNFINRKPSCDN